MVSSNEFTTKQYLEQAQIAIDKFEYELAIKILFRSFELDPQPLVAFKLATCLLELSNSGNGNRKLAIELKLENEEKEIVDCAQEWLERALKSFEKSEPLWSGGESFCKWQIYLSLAQLNGGEAAIEYYRLSIDDLKNDVHKLDSQSPDQKNTLNRYLSNALCALCEIYMTDCCDFPDAESKCMEYITDAQTIDPQNPEVFSTLASILLSRCMPDQAREAMLKNLDLWYVDPHLHQKQHIPGDDIDQEDMSVDLTAFSSSWPSFDARMVIAKLLVEVEEYKKAIGVIETLFAENDEYWEVWYLFGICYMRMAELGSEECKDKDGCMKIDGEEDSDDIDTQDTDSLINDAKECFEKILQLNEKFVTMGEDPLDEYILTETKELIQEVESLSSLINGH